MGGGEGMDRIGRRAARRSRAEKRICRALLSRGAAPRLDEDQRVGWLLSSSTRAVRATRLGEHRHHRAYPGSAVHPRHEQERADEEDRVCATTTAGGVGGGQSPLRTRGMGGTKRMRDRARGIRKRAARGTRTHRARATACSCCRTRRVRRSSRSNPSRAKSCAYRARAREECEICFFLCGDL